jgi:hypothetical protein
MGGKSVPSLSADAASSVPDSSASTPTSSSLSSRSSITIPQYQAQAYDPPYIRHERRKEHILQHFLQSQNDKTPTMQCRVSLRNTKKNKARQWFYRKWCILLYPGTCHSNTTHSNKITTLHKGMLKYLVLYVCSI